MRWISHYLLIYPLQTCRPLQPKWTTKCLVAIGWAALVLVTTWRWCTMALNMATCNWLLRLTTSWDHFVACLTKRWRKCSAIGTRVCCKASWLRSRQTFLRSRSKVFTWWTRLWIALVSGITAFACSLVLLNMATRSYCFREQKCELVYRLIFLISCLLFVIELKFPKAAHSSARPLHVFCFLFIYLFLSGRVEI